MDFQLTEEQRILQESARRLAQDSPGFFLEKVERWTSKELRSSVYFDDCRVSKGNVLVWEDGFTKLTLVVNIERAGN